MHTWSPCSLRAAAGHRTSLVTDLSSPHTCCSPEEITLFRQCSDLFYTSCLAAYISPIHLHWSCNYVIYQETTILSNLNEWFQHSPAVSNKVSGIFSHSWYYQITGSTEITYYSYLLFLKFSSGPSSLVLKVQNELCVISLGLISMWESLLCALAWALVSDHKEHA